MLVRVEHPEDLPRLVSQLQFDPEAIVTAVSTDEVEIDYLGSLTEEAQRRRLESRLAGWQVEWGHAWVRRAAEPPKSLLRG